MRHAFTVAAIAVIGASSSGCMGSFAGRRLPGNPDEVRARAVDRCRSYQYRAVLGRAVCVEWDNSEGPHTEAVVPSATAFSIGVKVGPVWASVPGRSATDVTAAFGAHLDFSRALGSHVVVAVSPEGYFAEHSFADGTIFHFGQIGGSAQVAVGAQRFALRAELGAGAGLLYESRTDFPTAESHTTWSVRGALGAVVTIVRAPEYDLFLSVEGDVFETGSAHFFSTVANYEGVAIFAQLGISKF